MTWPLWLLAGMAWLIVWVWIIVTCVAAREGDALVAIFRSLLPAGCTATCLASFLTVPERQPTFHRITLWAHHASVFLLFLFLITAEYFQAEAGWRIWHRCSTQSVAASFRRLWLLTELTPAPIAVAVLLTGLRLIWDSPQVNSPSSLWLFVMVVGYSLFFWDGILGYRPIVRRMWRDWKQSADAGIPVARPACTRRYATDTLQLALHFFSWPLISVFGLFRWNALTLPTQAIAHLIGRLRVLPPGWPEVTTAALLWLLAGVLVASVRACFRPHQAFDR